MQDTALTLQAMKGANVAMKSQLKDLNIDDLEVCNWSGFLFVCLFILLSFLFSRLTVRIFRTSCRTCLTRRTRSRR
jgi:hypothetical protein